MVGGEEKADRMGSRAAYEDRMDWTVVEADRMGWTVVKEDGMGMREATRVVKRRMMPCSIKTICKYELKMITDVVMVRCRNDVDVKTSTERVL